MLKTETTCPTCGGVCDRDEVDIGVGTVCSPWFCPACHWTQDDEIKKLLEGPK